MTRPFARVYHDVLDDQQFEGIYDDDAAFATWVRLLLMADAAYPTTVPVPRSVAQEPLDKLVAAGLVDLTGHDHYRIRGMAKDRDGRQAQAVAAGKARASDAHRVNGRFTSDVPAAAGVPVQRPPSGTPAAGPAEVQPIQTRPDHPRPPQPVRKTGSPTETARAARLGGRATDKKMKDHRDLAAIAERLALLVARDVTPREATVTTNGRATNGKARDDDGGAKAAPPVKPIDFDGPPAAADRGEPMRVLTAEELQRVKPLRAVLRKLSGATDDERTSAIAKLHALGLGP